MNDKIFVRPARAGLIVHNFARKDMRPIAEDGEYVENDPQWLRYQSEGSIIIGEPVITKPKISKKGDEA